MADGGRSDVRAPDGTRLAVYEWGDPSGPEIVLVHGFAQSHLWHCHVGACAPFLASARAC